MRAKIATTLALLLLAAVPFTQTTTAQTGAGWVSLFDGETLNNFDTVGDANWRLEGGAIVADKGNGFLVSKASYGDFQLRAEFWADEVVNSGIFIRSTDPKEIGTKTAYEVNIWDQRPEPQYGTGAIVDVGKVDPMPKAAGKWNVYEITAKGSSFTIVLNGQKTVDNAQDSKFANGRIALQKGLGLKDDKGVAATRARSNSARLRSGH